MAGAAGADCALAAPGAGVAGLLVAPALLALAAAIPPLWLALSLSFQMSFAGFPDGAVTEYDKARVTPNNLLIGATLLFCGWVVFRAFRVRNLRDTGMIAAILVGYVILFVGIDGAIAYYLKYILVLDYGQGG